MTKFEKDYHAKYGSIPDTKEGRIEYIKELYRLREEAVEEEKKRIANIPWKSLQFILEIEPRPTPRPRYSEKIHGFYVKGAAENKRYFESVMQQYEVSSTRTEFIVEIYQPTPATMKPFEKLLSEEGFVRPETDKDWDNYGKAYSDMIQGILIMNDCTITMGRVDKYYSIKPRVVIIINYMADYDSDYNRTHLMNSKFYKEIERSKDRGFSTGVEFDPSVYNEEKSKILRTPIRKPRKK